MLTRGRVGPIHRAEGLEIVVVAARRDAGFINGEQHRVGGMLQIAVQHGRQRVFVRLHQHRQLLGLGGVLTLGDGAEHGRLVRHTQTGEIPLRVRNLHSVALRLKRHAVEHVDFWALLLRLHHSAFVGVVDEIIRQQTGIGQWCGKAGGSVVLFRADDAGNPQLHRLFQQGLRLRGVCSHGRKGAAAVFAVGIAGGQKIERLGTEFFVAPLLLLQRHVFPLSSFFIMVRYSEVGKIPSS
jgi:hypothetical protein